MMKSANSLLIFIIFYILSPCSSVQCNWKHTNPHFTINASSSVCEGDVCAILRSSTENFNDFQFCYKGLHTYNAPNFCEERVDGSILCLCQSDYCNTLNLPDRLSVSYKTLLPCYFDDMATTKLAITGMTYCHYGKLLSFGTTIESRTPHNTFSVLPISGANLQLPTTPYPNSCYNFTSTSSSYTINCYCGWEFCNKEIPYEIKEGNVKCYTEESTIPAKDVFCYGQYCTLSLWFGTKVRGCLNVYEEGPLKLEIGVIQSWDDRYYICNSDFCNDNENTAIESAATFKRSSSYESYRQSLKQTPAVRENDASSVSFLIFISFIIAMFLLRN